MITDKERAQMADDMDELCREYSCLAISYGADRDLVNSSDYKSMAENYRALARALREGKSFEGWA